ncbi:hypothetical protein ABT160_46455 [Streptomyces sp. NPDC001941]|uniref:hypothetical protein n=1 Tax=Streptomyces sp. NPDC001941 TaxID=3154659 RepID=UPI003326CB6F
MREVLMFSPVPDDDPLNGLRPHVEGDLLGHEPTEGFADRCWVLHPIRVGGQKVRWNDFLRPYGKQLGDWMFTPSFRVFGRLPRPLTEGYEEPTIGEIDRDTLARLLTVTARHSAQGAETECFWVPASVHTPGYPVKADRGPLSSALAHFDGLRDSWRVFPAHWWPVESTWPVEGSWFVVTDEDLSATEVFGPRELIADLLADDELDAVRHPSIADVWHTGSPTWRDEQPVDILPLL